MHTIQDKLQQSELDLAKSRQEIKDIKMRNEYYSNIYSLKEHRLLKLMKKEVELLEELADNRELQLNIFKSNLNKESQYEKICSSRR